MKASQSGFSKSRMRVLIPEFLRVLYDELSPSEIQEKNLKKLIEKGYRGLSINYLQHVLENLDALSSSKNVKWPLSL